MGITYRCVIRQFLASQEFTGDMIFGWLECFVEVQTEKTEKFQKYRKNFEKIRKKLKQQIRKIPKNQILQQISIWAWFFRFFLDSSFCRFPLISIFNFQPICQIFTDMV